MQLHAGAEKGTFTDEKTLTFDATSKYRGAAMYGENNSVLQNNGDLVVSNAGSGMFVDNATAFNRGTITLNADHDGADTLYGMVAINGGVIVNDAEGIININTDKGLAFYRDDSSYLFNNGTVNFNGESINADAPNFGSQTPFDDTWDKTYLTSGHIGNTGETLNLSTEKESGFVSLDVTNYGDTTLASAFKVIGEFTNAGTLGYQNGGTLITDSLRNQGTITDGVALAGKASGYIYNFDGAMIKNNPSTAGELINLGGAGSTLYNAGNIVTVNGSSAVVTGSADNPTNKDYIFNDKTGVIRGENVNDGALIELGRFYKLYNQGEITLNGNNAVAIKGMNSAYDIGVYNSGVINLGTEEGKNAGTNGKGLIAIQIASPGKFYNNADGVINIWADNSYAFELANTARKPNIVNNGTINLLCNTDCGVFKNDATAQREVKGDDVWSPPAAPTSGLLTNYIIGTNADGTAGTFAAKDIVIGNKVMINSAFTAGSADTAVTFSDVFQARSISGEENITSSTVVWNASASKNAEGNVDVTMTKNEYADVVTDTSVSSVATALDKSYTNNALFSSLNVGSTASLNKALKQISGAQAKGVDRETRVLSQRFTMLAENAPVTTAGGLSFNLVAKGDKRAEMDNKVTYDMLALRQTFDVGTGELSAAYGIARLSGKGGNDSTRAGDNGLTGGYSQFYGLGYSLPVGGGYIWDNNLRYDRHQLDSRRSLSFEGVNASAASSGLYQSLEYRSEGKKQLTVADGLTVTPFAGMAMRHNATDGYQESGAGDFNLKVDRYSETTVDVVTGLRLNYAGQNGWGANATLEAGPNVGYSQSGRTASLQGMKGQSFRVDTDKERGGLNSRASVGANYRSGNVGFDMNAYQWKENGASDNGFVLNVSRSF